MKRGAGPAPRGAGWDEEPGPPSRLAYLPAALPLGVLHHGAGAAAQLRVQPLLHLHEEAVHVYQGHHALPAPRHPAAAATGSRPTERMIE